MAHNKVSIKEEKCYFCCVWGSTSTESIIFVGTVAIVHKCGVFAVFTVTARNKNRDVWLVWRVLLVVLAVGDVHNSKVC